MATKRENNGSGDGDDGGGGNKRAKGGASADDTGKRFQLFPKLAAAKRASLQFDDEAFFSVTDQKSAVRINKCVRLLHAAAALTAVRWCREGVWGCGGRRGDDDDAAT